MNYKTFTGMVLRHDPLRETDEIVTFWSWEEGKVRLLVRGVRKQDSRLKTILSPLTWLALHAVPSSYLPVVTSAKAIKSFSGISSSLNGFALIFGVFEMVLKTTPDGQPNEELTMLLRKGLEHLDEGKSAGLDFMIDFKLGLFSALGYQLSFSRCVHCQSENSEREGQTGHFSQLAAGLLCKNCHYRFSDAKSTDLRLFQYLNKLGSTETQFLITPAGDYLKKQADGLLSDFLLFVTEREMKSKKFLEQNIKA
ncbi:MAG: DNA repair protein RecO [Candidatus Doudnabacteria bacterium CG10_big_fil_rev_8_21_14_0_10_41_10]|uniref:DNA repair protein RecO n=1 Tax=Candidatus Doudnabacteria bacterium CG10_big_fil_rev_8_21_14_0_10_41_10 TaxID=1974551 RepID=A0A2H0VF20_9BACT|nr:MAG: DNA repair protein RecO [Candidatus Doudnabacteria bacterium CG10_big_fil_rev_8_21_14_0_10_41_10]